MPTMRLTPTLGQRFSRYIHGLAPDEEFTRQTAASACGTYPQAIDYHMTRARLARLIRKSGSKPGVWVRRPAKGAP